MASVAVASIARRFLDDMEEPDPTVRKNVEFRLASQCRLTKAIRNGGKQQTRIIFYEAGNAPAIGARGLAVDVAGVEVLLPSQAAAKFPREAQRCGTQRWSRYAAAKRLCCIILGDRRVPVFDVILLRPLNVWLQRQVNHNQHCLMFCMQSDLGKTVKLDGRTVKLEVSRYICDGGNALC